MLIRLSHSAWKKIKDCPLSYRLRYLDQAPKLRDQFYALPGLVVSRQTEEWFRIPAAERDLAWFAETFERFWQERVEGSVTPGHENYTEWLKHGARIGLKAGEVFDSDQRLFELAYAERHRDALDCSRRLAQLIQTLGLERAEAQTEVKFDVVIEPEDAVDQSSAHTLQLHGFIDLVLTRPDGALEVWDWKAVAKPSNLDVDQLAFYTMAVRPGNPAIARVGYLLVRQGRAETRNVTTADEYALRRRLRQVAAYYTHGWPANPQAWKCGNCDVRMSCSEYTKR